MAWIRKDKPAANNKFYNTRSYSGYSTCIEGEYYTHSYCESRGKTFYAGKYGVPHLAGKCNPQYSVLPNCVGLASAAFNETFVRNSQIKGLKWKDKDVVDKEYFALNCNANGFIKRAESLGLATRSPDECPPLGGIIVWGNGANHVAYITKVYDKGNGNYECDVIQSGYGGWNGDPKGGNDPVWCSAVRRIRKSSGWDSGAGGDKNKCIGFVVNPAIKDDFENVTYSLNTPLDSISIHSLSSSVHDDGGTLQLGIVYHPAEHTQKITSIAWSSSNTNVLTVNNATGLVTGKIKGNTAKVTATVKVDGVPSPYVASCDISVINNTAVADVVSISDTTIEPKTSSVMAIDVSPSTAKINSITWSSSNTKVATIDGSGLVTGLRGGQSTITVKVKSGSKELTGTALLTVKPRKGIYIKNKLHTPFIYVDGKWRKATLKVGKGKKWKNSIEDISKNS